MSNDTKKIAIVGMGVAGVSVLREWTKEKEINPSIELTVFGDEDTFGTGEPYQKDNEKLIMNQPAELATIIPENKYDFVEWLQITQNEEDPRLGYYPRKLFGEYLKERMNEWLVQSKAEVIKEEIKTIRILPNNKFRLVSSSNIEDFDAVHLCIGNFPYKDHYNLIDHPNFFINPFPVDKTMAMIPEGSTVGVLGTGLTSIDILRFAYFNRPDLNVSFFSHSGRFKSVRGQSIPIEYQFFTEENIKSAKEKNNGFISLNTYIEWFKKEIEYQGLSLKNNWLNVPLGSKYTIKSDLEDSDEIGVTQTVLLGMDPFLTELWMALKETDKQMFFDKYYGIWDKLRSSFPIVSGEILISAWEENKISVFDNLVNVVENEESFKFILKDQEPQHTDFIINAAGTETNVSYDIERIPLLRQLLNDRVLQPETFGGVQVSLPALSAVSQRYGVLETMKIHGPLISGIQFGNNSIDIISESARTAVLDIVQKIKD